MIKKLAEPGPVEVADIKFGDHCIEIYADGALILVPIYDEDENLNFAPVRVPTMSRSGRALLADAVGRIDPEGEE